MKIHLHNYRIVKAFSTTHNWNYLGEECTVCLKRRLSKKGEQINDTTDQQTLDKINAWIDGE